MAPTSGAGSGAAHLAGGTGEAMIVATATLTRATAAPPRNNQPRTTRSSGGAGAAATTAAAMNWVKGPVAFALSLTAFDALQRRILPRAHRAGGEEDGEEQWGSWSGGNDSGGDSRFVDSRAVRTGGAGTPP